MSKESVSEFFLAVSSDETLQEKLAAATQPENFIKIAQEKGYSFTTEELFAVISEQNNGELNDEELNTVAGGIAFTMRPGHPGCAVPCNNFLER